MTMAFSRMLHPSRTRTMCRQRETNLLHLQYKNSHLCWGERLLWNTWQKCFPNT